MRSTVKNKKRLLIVFGLTTSYMIAEAIAGFLTGSLALLADAGHMFTDASALGLSLFAIWFAGRPANEQKSYGYYRAEILAALVNAVLLLFISVYILYEAWERFQTPPSISSFPMLVVASIGAFVNLAGMKLLSEGSSENLNMKGAYLEVLSDLVASLGVIVGAIIMLATRWYWVDPIISAGIGLFIVPRTWALLKQAVHVLMEGSPPHIDLKKLENEMIRVNGVKAVHDLHVWTITSGVDALSAHVTVENFVSGNNVLESLNQILKEKFGIDHTTLQIESVDAKNVCQCRL